MAAHVPRRVTAESFQHSAGYAHPRNVLLMGQEKRITLLWPDSKGSGGVVVVMDKKTTSFLALVRERNRRRGKNLEKQRLVVLEAPVAPVRIPDSLLFRGMTQEGRRAIGKKRVVSTAEARKILGISLERFHDVAEDLEMVAIIDGFQVWGALAVEK